MLHLSQPSKMRPFLLALSWFVFFGQFTAGNALPARFGDSLVGDALPQLPAGFAPEVDAPPPTAGEDLPSYRSHGWWVSGGPPPEASPSDPRAGPDAGASTPSGLAGGIPFISANPAVPLPTAETDAAAARPLPTPGGEAQEAMVGIGTRQRARMLPLLVTIILSRAFGV